MDLWTIAAVAGLFGALGGLLPCAMLMLGVKGYIRAWKTVLHDHDTKIDLLIEKQQQLFRKFAGQASAEKRVQTRSLHEEAMHRLQNGDGADGAARGSRRPSVVHGR